MRKYIYSIYIVLASALSALPGMTIKAAENNDNGSLFSLVHWDGMQPTNKGVAQLPTDAASWSGRLDYVWNIKTYPYNYGGCHFEDKYYCNFLRIMNGYVLEQKAYILDDKTGEELETIQLPTAFDLFDGAYFEPEEIIYASIRDMSTDDYGWARLNPRTARFEIIRLYPEMILYGVAMTDDGEAYGISGDGEVYKIDRTSGKPTFLFSHEDLETKTVPKAHTGATWDEENHRIVYAVCNLEKDGGSRLFSIDPGKGTVELMYKLDGMGTQLAGLYFEQSVAPEAPASVTDLSVDFQPGKLSGAVGFTLPSLSHDGNLLNGNVEYVVKIDGVKAAEGVAENGTKVEAAVTVEKAGWHTVYVTCSNNHGKGRSSKLETYIGFEAPLPPSEVSARHYGGSMHITWKASPAEGREGGPVNTETIRYHIRSNHDEEFVTEPGATSYEFVFTTPEQFTARQYSVTAVNADGESAAALSNNVPLGTVNSPYTQDFTSKESVFDFTTIDANNDGKCWEWNEEGFMVVRYNDKLDMNDYLTLPPMNMEYGEYYTFDFDAGVYNFEEKFAVVLAEDYNRQGVENGEVVFGPVTVPARDMRQESWTHYDVVLTPPDDGKYFLSIHGVSPADRNVLFVDNISLRRLAASTVPAAITGLKAIPDSKGALKVRLTGLFPSKDVAGNEVAGIDYVKVMRNGQLIATVDTKGMDSFEWTDDNALRGENSYITIAGNSDGDGLGSRCSAYAGFVNPKTPESCDISYLGNGYGTVEFSWDPVKEDLNGLDVSDAVAYDVIRAFDGDMSYGIRNTNATSFRDNFSALSTPNYVQYGVYAVADSKNGEMTVSPQIPVGPAYQLPLTEGFCKEIKMAYGMTSELTSEESGLYTTNDTEKYQSADNDGGYGVFIGKNADESTTLYTAWIHIPNDAVQPEVSIQYFGEGDAISNLIHIGVSTGISEDFRLEKTIETGGMDWQKATVNLDSYRGRDIRIALKFETVGNTYLRFDDFRVEDAGAAGGFDKVYAEGVEISTGKGILDVRTPDGEDVMITSLDGMKIYEGPGDIILNVKAGVYVVSAGGKNLKTIVR